VPTLPGLPSRSSTASSLVSAPAHSQTQTAPTGPVWTADEEKTATDEYWAAMADNAVYDLMRHFAEATRALALFDVGECVSVLDRLPVVHQRSPWAMIMLGKAHYEKTEYAEVGCLTWASLFASAIFVLSYR
jgi:anaphase-promoting complex subunit 3